jgi:ketosteroid isomerase-like protein
MAVDHLALLERFVDAMNRHAYAALGELMTEDCVQEYPQSGEVIRGRANFRAILEHYPQGLPERAIDRPSLRVAVSDELRVVAPLYKVIRVEGAGNHGTYAMRSRYPDGSTWWVVGLYQVRDGKIANATVFFAQDFDAPAWRIPYVEQGARQAR